MKVCARELMAIGGSVGNYVTPNHYYFGVVIPGE